MKVCEKNILREQAGLTWKKNSNKQPIQICCPPSFVILGTICIGQKTNSAPIWNPGGGTASVVRDEGQNDDFVSNIGYMLSRVSEMYADNKQKNIPIVDTRQTTFL